MNNWALFENKKIWGTVLIVILFSGTLSVSLLIFPKNTYISEAQVVPGVMQDKLNQAATTLQNAAATPEQHQQAVDEIMEALFVSNLVPLPTQGEPQADLAFAEHLLRMDQAIAELSNHINGIGGESADEAAEARNFLQLVNEAMQVIGAQTGQCNPVDQTTGAGCPFLQQEDEGLTIDPIYSGFSREVRNPFFYGISLSPTPQEDVRVIPALKNKECSAIMKETAGWKVVVRPIIIPIWVEPWFARAAIVGFTTVWVWEFVPMEFIKTIEYCNINSDIVQQIEMEATIDRPLMHMWKFWPKDP